MQYHEATRGNTAKKSGCGIWETRDPRGEAKEIPKVALLQILASNQS